MSGQSSSLETIIAKSSLSISKKMLKANAREALNICAALALLSQAQLLIESNPPLSRLLYSRAQTLAGRREIGAPSA